MHKYKTHVVHKGSESKRRGAEIILSTLIKKQFADADSPVLIAIGGPGGTGKTTFAKRLCKQLPGATILTLDDYKTPRSVRQKQNLFGAHPNANEMDLILSHLKTLKQNQSIKKP
ncbi:MAG: AAA family ATPase, partial [Planctomycetota bacterium]